VKVVFDPAPPSTLDIKPILEILKKTHRLLAAWSHDEVGVWVPRTTRTGYGSNPQDRLPIEVRSSGVAWVYVNVDARWSWAPGKVPTATWTTTRGNARLLGRHWIVQK
jgi:hypothetical protein